MTNQTYIYAEYNAIVKMTSYKPAEQSVGEYNLMINLTDSRLSFTQQIENIKSSLAKALEAIPLSVVPVFKRYFLSDAANQVQWIPNDETCAVSIVEQPPLNGTKIALWVYLVEGFELSRDEYGNIFASHNEYTQIWRTSMTVPFMSSEVATIAILGDWATILRRNGCTLADNCLRTWFFVHDVDINYHGVVKGRNKVFENSGLTVDTHFISSTGIGGKNADCNALVAFDGYAVDGVSSDQIRYLTAPENLNPTYEYGVAFERGTSIDYGDRRHVLISGTASIDKNGKIMYPGDIVNQTYRMIDNVKALLKTADCNIDDISYGIVYLRDNADYDVVSEIIEKHLPDVPLTIVWAPVCRTGWLVEMECAAIKEIRSPYAPL